MEISRNKDGKFTLIVERYELSNIAFHMSKEEGIRDVSHEFRMIEDYLINSGYFADAFKCAPGVSSRGNDIDWLLENYAKRLSIATNINKNINKELLATLFECVVNYYNKKMERVSIRTTLFNDLTDSPKKMLDIITTVIPTCMLNDVDAVKEGLQSFVNNLEADKPSFEFNVYDIIVFKNKDGDIYQDCICAVEKPNIYGVTLAYCNSTHIAADKNGPVWGWYIDDKGIHSHGNIIEVWRRSDEGTYKKVWSK